MTNEFFTAAVGFFLWWLLSKLETQVSDLREKFRSLALRSSSKGFIFKIQIEPKWEKVLPACFELAKKKGFNVSVRTDDFPHKDVFPKYSRLTVAGIHFDNSSDFINVAVTPMGGGTDSVGWSNFFIDAKMNFSFGLQNEKLTAADPLDMLFPHLKIGLGLEDGRLVIGPTAESRVVLAEFGSFIKLLEVIRNATLDPTLIPSVVNKDVDNETVYAAFEKLPGFKVSVPYVYCEPVMIPGDFGTDETILENDYLKFTVQCKATADPINAEEFPNIQAVMTDKAKPSSLSPSSSSKPRLRKKVKK